MHFAIAVVLALIAFGINAYRKSALKKQQNEYMEQRRKGPRTSREYLYANFEYAKLMERQIAVAQECNRVEYAEKGKLNFEASDQILNEYFKTLRHDHATYTAEEYAVCKAREIILSEGYIPSNVSGYTLPENYNPWWRLVRHRYPVSTWWPNPGDALEASKIDLIPGYDMAAAIRETDEIAEKYGYQDYCRSILNFRQDPDTGTYYIAKTIQRPPCDNPREQMKIGLPDRYNAQWKETAVSVLADQFLYPPQIIDEE